MKEIKAIVIITLLGILFGSKIYAQEFSKVGQAGATFLKIEVGSRGVAMGGSQVALVKDASALYWNPAGIGFLTRNSFHFTYNAWIADISHNFVGFALPIERIGSIGVSITSLSYGEMEETTVEQPDGTGMTFGANDFAIGLSFARQLLDNFTAGITIRYVNQKIWDMSANGICFDVGTVFRTPFKGVSFGMVISNFGQNMTFSGQQLIRKDEVYNNVFVTSMQETEGYQLPLVFKLGVAYELLNTEMNKVILAVDGVHPNDNVEYANLGAEYVWSNTVALRAGYKANTDIQGLSAGAGFMLNLGSLTAKIDYAFSDIQYFDAVHRFSVGIEF